MEQNGLSKKIDSKISIFLVLYTMLTLVSSSVTLGNNNTYFSDCAVGTK